MEIMASSALSRMLANFCWLSCSAFEKMAIFLHRSLILLPYAKTGYRVGPSNMEFLYCFTNASLIQRVLTYLLRQLRSHVKYVTVIFLNDRWVLRVNIDPSLDEVRCKDCWAVLNENGFPYQPTLAITLALKDLDTGDEIISVMNRHQVVIVSHGTPNPNEICYFRDQFVEGLGYCPQSLG